MAVSESSRGINFHCLTIQSSGRLIALLIGILEGIVRQFARRANRGHRSLEALCGRWRSFESTDAREWKGGR